MNLFNSKKIRYHLLEWKGFPFAIYFSRTADLDILVSNVSNSGYVISVGKDTFRQFFY